MTTETTEDLPLAYDYKGAAYQSSCSVSHIRKMVAEGYLRSIRPPGTTKPLILRSDLEAWLKPDED